MAVEERKLAEDDKELPKEKLGRSDGQQTHTTNNTNISFTKEKVETKGRAKNSKWIVPYKFQFIGYTKKREKEGTKK